MLRVNFCLFFHFFDISFFLKSTNTVLYIILHYITYYSNDFDLRKIRVAQNLQEWNDCIIQKAPVLVNIYLL
jgi:hypothetical protein